MGKIRPGHGRDPAVSPPLKDARRRRDARRLPGKDRTIGREKPVALRRDPHERHFAFCQP